MINQPRLNFSRIAIYATLLLAAAVYLIPLVVMLLTSFKTPEDIRTGNLLSWPQVVDGIGWIKAWDVVGVAVFKLKADRTGDIAAQQDLAKVALGKDFQKIFSINKGSIPVRTDMLNDMSTLGFDACAQASAKDFLADEKTGGLQPSMAHNMATSLAVQGAIFDVVTNFMNDKDADPAKASAQLASAVKAAQ